MSKTIETMTGKELHFVLRRSGLLVTELARKVGRHHAYISRMYYNDAVPLIVYKALSQMIGDKALLHKAREEYKQAVLNNKI